MKHSELMARLGLDTTGKLNFHLNKLESLVTKEKTTGSYFLSEEGKQVIRLMDINDRLLKGEDLPSPMEKRGEINRVGVIICNCNGEVSDCVNVPSLEQHARRVPDVTSVKVFDNLCQEKHLKGIHQWCKDNYLNKIVIAACSPKTHQPVFEAMFDGVIEKPNIEIVNIREQLAWVHNDELFKEAASHKAQVLVEAGVARVSLQKSVQQKTVQIERSCGIIGGGIAGMTLALNLARAGIQVYLIEKSLTLGGMGARWNKIQGMSDCSICFISELVGEIKKQKNITIYTNTKVENITGEVGSFTLDLVKYPRFIEEDKCTGCGRCTKICIKKKENQFEFGLDERGYIYIPFSHAYPYAAAIDEENIHECKECGICARACTNKAINLDQEPVKIRIKVGAKAIAVGASLFDPTQTGLPHDPGNDIITSPEFERILSSDGPTGGKLVKLSDHNPPRSIAFIQDITPRVAQNLGDNNAETRASLSQQLARKYMANVKEHLPKVPFRVYDAGSVQIEIDGKKFIVDKSGKHHEADMIVLGIGLVPNPDLKELRKRFDFTLDDDGFMSEETLSSGIFGVGSVLGPKTYADVVYSTGDPPTPASCPGIPRSARFTTTTSWSNACLMRCKL